MKTLSLFIVIVLGIFGSAKSQTARLQVIHNSADAAASVVDVYLNGSLLLDDFAFRTATPFINAPANVPLTIDVAPFNSTSVAQSVANFTVTLADQETYVVVANGIVSPTGYSPATPFNLYVFAQARESALNSQSTDILVFHGSTDAPVVDVNEVTLGGATIIDGMAYSDFAGYLSLPVENYGLQILPDDQSVVVAEYLAPLSDLNLDGVAMTVIASGFLNPSTNNNGPAFGLWAALPTGGPLVELPMLEYASVQVIHNSADLAAQEVDVYLNGNLLIDNFAFRTATPFVDLASDLDHTIAVAPSNSMSVNDAIAEFPVMLMADESYVVVANGIVSPTGYSPATPFDLHVYPGARTVSAGTNVVDVLVFHGSTDAPAVDIVETLVGAGNLISFFSYSDFSGYLELPLDNYGLDILPHGQTSVVESYQVPLETLGLGGQALTVVASGFLNPAMNSNGPAFGLWVALSTGGNLIPLPVVTSVQDFDISDNIRVYPNPVQDVLTIETGGLSSVSAVFTDISGKTVLDLKVQDQTQIDVSSLSRGTYFLNLYNDNFFSTEKIIVTR